MTREDGRPDTRTVVAVAVSLAVLAGSIAAYAVFRSDASKSESAATDVTEHAAEPSASAPSRELVQALIEARAATVKYATNLAAAKADGYRIITTMMPDMGVHYLNPNIKGFDLDHPAILVYVGRGASMQLAALEWVFPKTPEKPPLPDATYGSFDAACHYADGEFIAGDEASCTPTHPITNAAFFFWHPKLVTLHVWLWYPNPDGLYHGTNPLVRPYN